MTIQLCGFAASNYYNKIKLQLLEKGLAFEEVLVWAGSDDAGLRQASPMGKVPYLLTEKGPISESMACADYLEAAYLQTPLIAADPYVAAKTRELVLHCELNLELVARTLFPQVFMGLALSPSNLERTHKLLRKGLAGLAQLVRFAPFIGGDSFTLADCAAIAHFPVISRVTQQVYGEDLLAPLPVKAYLDAMSQRASVARMQADRKANMPLFLAHYQAR